MAEADQSSKKQKNHYVPRWLLKKFRDPLLFELNIHTVQAEQRNPKTGASEVGLWTADIEDGLSVHDNAAAKIYGDKISDRRQVVLEEGERRAFALFVASMIVRSPRRVLNIEASLNDADLKGELVGDLYADRQQSLKRIREQNPEPYAKAVADWGKDQAEEAILALYADYIRRAQLDSAVRAKDVRQHYMRTATTDQYADVLLKYNWIWLGSPHGFVIADDPVVSWHVQTKHWSYGISLPGVEITLPLSPKLCLLMQQRHWNHDGYLQNISARRTLFYNRRQRLSAIRFVYGNDRKLLDFVQQSIMA